MKKVHDLAQYNKRYQILYDLLKSYNEGSVSRHVSGPFFGQKLKYSCLDIGEEGNPILFFKTDRPDVLKHLIDKCDEWFVHGDYAGGIFAFLNDQEVYRIPNLKKLGGVTFH